MSAGACPRCLGDGWWDDRRCRRCGGTGRLYRDRETVRLRRLLWVVIVEMSGLLVLGVGVLFGWWSS